MGEPFLPLSSTLLTLFITSTDNFNVHSHLVLLCSYLLIAAPHSKSILPVCFVLWRGRVDQSLHYSCLDESQAKSLMRVNHLDRVTWPPVKAILRSCLAELLISSTWTINFPSYWRFWNLLTFSYCDFFTRNVLFLQESTLVYPSTVERAMKSVTVFRMSTCRSTLNSLFPAPTKSRKFFLKK